MSASRARPARPTWHRPGAAVASAAAALVLLAGCSRDNAALDSSVPAPAPPLDPFAAIPTVTPTLAPTGTEPLGSSAPAPTSSLARPERVSRGPAPTSVTPPSTVPLDAALMLSTALDALVPGYHFTTTATVGGQVAVTAEGDHIAGSTHMAVTSGGTSTEYLVTGEAAWAFADGSWQQLESADGLRDPIAQLRDPVTASAAGTPEAATVTARYPNVVLGLPGEGEAAVEFHLAEGRITSLRYVGVAVVTNPDGSTAEQPAEVTATLAPVAPGTEITLPSVEG